MHKILQQYATSMTHAYEKFKELSHAHCLLNIFLVVLLVGLCFEGAGHLFFPTTGGWRAHSLSIFFSAISAALIAHLFLRTQQAQFQELLRQQRHSCDRSKTALQACRREQEDLLQEWTSSDRLNPSPVLRFDRHGLIIQANLAACEAFGHPSLDGLSAMDLFSPHLTEDTLQEGLLHETLLCFELQLDGRYYQFVLQSVPHLKIGHAYGVDISERKDAERELQHAQESAGQAGSLKGRALSNMSHELRTPLNVILGSCQNLLRSGGFSSRQQRALNAILQSGHTLLGTIDNVLDSLHIEGGDRALNSGTPEAPSPDNAYTYTRRQRPWDIDGTGYKILLVDDHANNLFVLKELLEPFGFMLREAAGGQDAIRQTRDFHPDVILMDLIMPDIDGFAATREIRQLPEGKQITIIALSASVSKERERQCLQEGFDAFLSKPIVLEKLVEFLKSPLIIERVARESNEKTSLKIPPESTLRQLLRLAKRGNPAEISECLQMLRNEDSSFTGFVQEFQHLLEDYHMKRIHDALIDYLGETDA